MNRKLIMYFVLLFTFCLSSSTLAKKNKKSKKENVSASKMQSNHSANLSIVSVFLIVIT
jgi:hypothetical protein